MSPKDEAPKSAYEIAMERLRRQDAERGETLAPLTEKQKQAIAEVRRVYKARIAELEILHQPELRKARVAGDQESIRKVEESYLSDRRRLEDEMESRIRAVREKTG